MSRSTAITLTAPDFEALSGAIAALDEAQRVEDWQIFDRTEQEGCWLASGKLIIEEKAPPSPARHDDRIALLIMSGIGVLCAVNLILLRLLVNVSPIDGLNIALLGFIALGLAWRCATRAMQVGSAETDAKPEPLSETSQTHLSQAEVKPLSEPEPVAQG